MTNLVKIIYVNTRSPGSPPVPPKDVEAIRDWSYDRCPVVRWYNVQADELGSVVDDANLIILDWSSKNSSEAEAVCRYIHRDWPDLPICIIESYSGQTPTRDSFVSEHKRAAILYNSNDQSQFESVLESLGFQLPEATLHVHIDPYDPALTGLMTSVGREKLATIIQKYFPDSQNATIIPVVGGWSDASLCTFWIDTDRNAYFLKFFKARDEYRSELDRHAEAKLWLRDCVVDLLDLPGLPGRAQSEAFPMPSKPNEGYPVGYHSASTYDCPRETLKQLYRRQSAEFTEASFDRVLQILATDQPANSKMQPPWSDSFNGAFWLNEKAKNAVIEAIHDSAEYGPALCGGDANRWDSHLEAIRKLVEYKTSLPKALSYAQLVSLGHVHGDPNPRNCLVNPDSPADVRLIDCGEYRSNGRLVSDLALIERDVKVVLLATDRGAPPFRELEAAQLPGWCQAESYSISQGLKYSPDLAPPRPESLNRAFRVVGQIRERARKICENEDKAGTHYFAALLYWTLDALRFPAVRPTKKLFALYSAAEIIRNFE